MPEEVELTITPPPCFAHLPPADYVKRLETALAIDEREIRAEMSRAGRTFAGARRVLSMNPTDAPTTPPSSGGINPRFATRDRDRLERAIDALKAFRDAYRRALLELRKKRRAHFPFGTWGLRVHLGVLCQAAPP